MEDATSDRKRNRQQLEEENRMAQERRAVLEDAREKLVLTDLPKKQAAREETTGGAQSGQPAAKKRKTQGASGQEESREENNDLLEKEVDRPPEATAQEVEPELPKEDDKRVCRGVPGLKYIPGFLTTEAQQALLAQIDKNDWLHDLKRRVQHYGYKYDYK